MGPWPHRACLARIILLLIGFSGASCVNPQIQTSRRRAALRDIATQFALDLRWQRYRSCANVIVPEVQDAFRSRIVERGDDLRVTEISIVGVEFSKDSFSATVRVSVRWVLMPSISEQRAVLEQRWEDRKQGWLLSRMIDPRAQGTGPLDIE